MNIYFGPPIVVPGVVVPCPDVSTYWIEDVPAVQPDRLIVYGGLLFGIVLEPTGGGAGTANIVVAEDGTAGLQVEMVQQGVWDVVMGDYFDDSLCAGVDQSLPYGENEHVFFGNGVSGELFRLNRSNQEAGQVITAFLRPNVIAPAGIGRSHLYKNVYLAVEGNTGGLVRITPVIDGEVLTDEEIIFAIPSDGSTRELQRFEIPLSRKYDVAAVEQSRAGIRGTWFTIEMEVLDVFGCGELTIGGVEVEFTVMTDSILGQTFTGESMTVPLSVNPTAWFFGGVGGDLNRGDAGTDDAGTDIAIVAQTNDIAPAGVGGECSFERVNLALTRFNAVDWDLTVTPIVDGVALVGQTLTLPGVANPVTELHDLSLAQPFFDGATEESKFMPRGAWIALRFTSTDAPDRQVLIEGPELIYEVLTESLKAVD